MTTITQTKQLHALNLGDEFIYKGTRYKVKGRCKKINGILQRQVLNFRTAMFEMMPAFKDVDKIKSGGLC